MIEAALTNIPQSWNYNEFALISLFGIVGPLTEVEGGVLNVAILEIGMNPVSMFATAMAASPCRIKGSSTVPLLYGGGGH